MLSKVDMHLMVKYRVIIEKDEDGVFVARVPDLPGCATEGKTRQEVMKNVKKAIQAYLEDLEMHGDDVAAIKKYEVAKKNKKLSLEPLSELTKGN